MTRHTSISVASVVGAGIVVALLLAFFVSPHASSSPDGLEKVAGEHSLDTETRPHDLADGPLAEYSVRGVDRAGLSTGLAGIIGVLATFGLTAGGIALSRRISARPRGCAAAATAGQPGPAA